MQLDDRLYKAFLEGMQDLENFRQGYAAAHPGAPLDRDDPDVRRLIEAMAFFAARTHMVGIRNIMASHNRIFQQFFPYLLAPQPAMGILQARPTGQFAEPAFLPKGSEIAVTPQDQGTAIFQTLGDLNILPIALTKMQMLLLPDKGFRLVLSLQAPYPRNDDIGQLSFHINHLNDYQASLRVFHALEGCLRKVSVVFAEIPTETTEGAPCEVDFGLPENGEQEDCSHPLQKEQLFFHFPQQDLYLNIHLPAPPRNWRQFALLLDVDSGWPKNLRLNEDVFHLFTVPIINIKRAMAQPFIHDGTQERYPVRYAEQGKGFELHSILGVYRIEKHALIPIRAGIIAGGSGSYEIEQSPDHTGKIRQWLRLHFPENLQHPQTITAEALWLQPWFSESLAQKLQVSPYSRSIVGLEWELNGSIVPHAARALRDEANDFLHLITLKNKSALNIDDLIALLQTLGSLHQGHFHRIADLMTGLRIEETPMHKNGTAGMVKLVYSVQLKEFEPGILPLVETFITHMGRILDAWISEAAVEVRREIPGKKEQSLLSAREKVAYEK